MPLFTAKVTKTLTETAEFTVSADDDAAAEKRAIDICELAQTDDKGETLYWEEEDSSFEVEEIMESEESDESPEEEDEPEDEAESEDEDEEDEEEPR